MASGSPVLEQSSRGAVDLPEQLGLWDPCLTPGACGDTAPLGPASLPPPAPGSHILPPCNHAAQLSGAGIWLHACSGVCYLPGMFNSWGRRKAGSRGPLAAPAPWLPVSHCPKVGAACDPRSCCLHTPTPARQRGWGRARRADPAAGHPGGAAARGPGSCLPHSLQRATVLTELLLTRQAFVPAAQRCLSGVLNRIKSCNQTRTHARRSARPSSPQSQRCRGAARLSPALPPELGGLVPPSQDLHEALGPTGLQPPSVEGG